MFDFEWTSVLKPARQLSGTAALSIREMMDVLSLLEIKKILFLRVIIVPF